jgi:hypothetical protein
VSLPVFKTGAPATSRWVGSIPSASARSLTWEAQVREIELRQTAGAEPWMRLNARLNASSESYPTRCAIAATVVSVVVCIS